MTAKGHILLASALTMGGAVYLKNHYPIYLPSSLSSIIAILGGIYLGALLPDIEEPESYIGNKFKLFSIVFASFIKHRTLTHYLITPTLIIALAFYVLTPYSFSQLFFYALAIGMVMHDIGDMLTNGGIRGFFFPFFPNTRIALLPSFLRLETFGFIEHLFIRVVLIPLNAYFIFQLGIFR